MVHGKFNIQRIKTRNSLNFADDFDQASQARTREIFDMIPEDANFFAFRSRRHCIRTARKVVVIDYVIGAARIQLAGKNDA